MPGMFSTSSATALMQSLSVCADSLFEFDQHLLDFHRIARHDAYALHCSSVCRCHLVLHLHGLEHHELVVRLHLLSGFDIHLDHQSGDRAAADLSAITMGIDCD